jgi:tRNA-dihydrouridine synthase
LYKGEADWTLIGEVKNNPRMKITIFGNGDIDSPQKALEYKNRYGVDGIMIGRASIGYPWIFREIKHYFAHLELMQPPTIDERIAVTLKHFNESIRWKGEVLGIIEMRRHYNNYFKGYPDFKPYRMRLVESMNKAEILQTLFEVSEVYKNIQPEHLNIHSEPLPAVALAY